MYLTELMSAMNNELYISINSLYLDSKEIISFTKYSLPQLSIFSSTIVIAMYSIKHVFHLFTSSLSQSGIFSKIESNFTKNCAAFCIASPFNVMMAFVTIFISGRLNPSTEILYSAK